MASKRKQVYLAVAGSVGIHLLVLFAWALSVQWFPNVEAASSQTPEQLKLEVVEEPPADTPPPEPEPISTPPPKPKLAFKETDDLPEASQVPKDAAFQSDRNAEAASELPATGDAPLPTQKGRPIPSFAFDSHPYTPGDAGGAVGQNVPENMPPTAPPPPRAAPKPPAQASPPPAPTPAASVADPRDLAMVTPQSIPSTPLEPENPYDPSFRPPSGMTEPPPPTPVPRRGGYRSQQQRADSSGGIEQTGSASIASEATPSGRYTAFVIRTIGQRWRQLSDARTDIIALGTVVVRFVVDREGKVHSLRVVSNTANEALASVSLRAVAETPIPPMPADVLTSSNGAMMPVELHFNLDGQTPF